MNSLRPFVEYTGITCLLIFDYFLFSTGNPSATYSILGGWFEITLIGLVTVSAVYGFTVLSNGKTRGLYIYHVIMIGLLSAVLFGISDSARKYAEERMRNQIMSFVANPVSDVVEASDESRKLMAHIVTGEYSVEPEGFIPTFRRSDFLLNTNADKRYRLIAIMSWKGTPQISVREVLDKSQQNQSDS